MRFQGKMSKLPIYSIVGEILKLPVVIKPQARKNQILGLHGDRLKIAIAATPVDGKANKELISFLAQLLEVRQAEIEIASGLTNHIKLICIPSALKSKIESIIAESSK